MKKVSDTSKVLEQASANQVEFTFDSDKPFLLFNTDVQICDCNELFTNKFNISKSELLLINLTLFSQNSKFIEKIKNAATNGVSTFHGKVKFGNSLPQVFLEALIVSTSLENCYEKGVKCYILESNIVFSEVVPDRGSKSLAGISSDLLASVSVHDSGGGVLYISPSLEALLGYTSSELKDINPFSLVHPEDIEVVKNVIEKLNSNSNYLVSRYRMIHKSGSIKLVETISYLISDISGEANHIINITWDLNAQQALTHALEISEQKYYRLVMNLPIGVSMINFNGQLLEANDSMRKIMRIPRDFPISQLNFFDIDTVNLSDISKQFSRCVESKEVVNGEASIKLSTKKPEKILVYTFVPIFGLNGDLESVIGYVSDINTIKTPFFVKDENHKWVMLNNAAAEMMGHPREALIGKSDYDIFPREQADVFWKFDELVFKEGSSTNEEHITWYDGTIHTIVTNKQLYIEKPLGKQYIIGTNHDITYYKKIEAELRASEKKYHEIFDNASDFIMILDIDGNITNANKTLLKYMDTDLESFTQLNVYSFIKEEHIDFANDIKARMLKGESELTFEIKALGIERQEVLYEVKAGLIFRNGLLRGVQCVFSNVTKRKEATVALEKYNASLLELSKTKDKFFSIIAHDLRNPFNSLIGFSEMLLEDLEESSKEQIRESLKIIYSVAKNSFNLLENLLAWSRLETGHMPFKQERVVLTNSIEDVINVLFSLAYRKKIGINNLVKPEIIVNADKNMLNIILNNLVMNAIKFTPIGGEIQIYTSPCKSEKGYDSDFIEISVADNGIGMDAEMRKKLFIPNRMVSNPGTEKEQGTGLGLLLTSEMVEKHGGKILVESTPGKGSVLSFLIPAYTATDTDTK